MTNIQSVNFYYFYSSLKIQKKPIEWSKLVAKEPGGPCPRSGHTMTMCRNNYYLFGGTVNGILDPNLKKIAPSNELWSLELPKKYYIWSRINGKGEIPAPRSNHVAITYKKKDAADNTAVIYIHGGMNESGKLEDCFLLDAPEGKFTKIETVNQGPSPRANHTAMCLDGKIYIFGGNGGRFYENSVFRDLWVLDIEKQTWTELKGDRKFIKNFLLKKS